MQSSGQCDGAEFTALAAEERAENSEVLKFQREPIRTRRLGLSCRQERVYADADRIMEVESQLEEIAPRTELKYASKHALFFNSQAHSDTGEMTGAVEGNTHSSSNKIPSSSLTVVSIGWQETCASLQVV